MDDGLRSELRPDETLIRTDPANIIGGVIPVGGMAILTSRRVVIEGHWIDIIDRSTSIPLGDIESMNIGWSRYLGLIPVRRNSLEIATTSSRVRRIVVADPEGWVSEIDSAIRYLDGSRGILDDSGFPEPMRFGLVSRIGFWIALTAIGLFAFTGGISLIASPVALLVSVWAYVTSRRPVRKPARAGIVLGGIGTLLLVLFGFPT